MARKQKPVQQSKPFESDTQKIVHRHLADPGHQISEEEIASVKIGMTSQLDEPTEQAIQDGEDRIADKKADNENATLPGAQKSTPWDVLGQ